MVASHDINLMLGSVGKPGGVLAPAATEQPLGNRAIVQALSHARVVFIDGANPVYAMPRSVGAVDALARAELVVAFGTFPYDFFLRLGRHPDAGPWSFRSDNPDAIGSVTRDQIARTDNSAANLISRRAHDADPVLLVGNGLETGRHWCR